jgi:stearoyl-CoA desaturase (delta-9 desaturase)
VTVNDWATTRILTAWIITVIFVPWYVIQGESLILFLAVRVIAGFLSDLALIGRHRWLSHRSLEPRPWARILLLFSMIATPSTRPLHYVIAHRAHHRWSDTEWDPHSPGNLTLKQMWLGRFSSPGPKIQVPRDFFRDPLVVWVDRYYWPLAALLFVSLALIWWPLALIVQPITVAWGSVTVLPVIYSAHQQTDGSVGPRNIGHAASWFTVGESLQENHHREPASLDFGLGTHWDGGYWISRLMHRDPA